MKALLAISTTLTLGIGMFVLPNTTAEAGGPDGGMPVIAQRVLAVVVPPGRRALIQTRFNAYYENAVLVEDDATQERVCESGNYGRGGDAILTLPRNTTSRPKVYHITGWHKLSPPDYRQRWLQSSKWVFSRTATTVQVGFEDGVDDDHNDAVVTVMIQ
jgi:hypothetical protein